MSSGMRDVVMVLSLIAGIGAIVSGITIRVLNRELLGVASLVFATLMLPAFMQANVLSILALVMLVLAGITLLVHPFQQPQSPNP